MYFASGIRREVGANAARLTLAFSLVSTAMFVSSTALLPSSTSMYLTMLSYGAWMRREYNLAILFTALSAFLSWPFAALLGVPIALDILFFRRKVVFFIRWVLLYPLKACAIVAFYEKVLPFSLVVLDPALMLERRFHGKTGFKRCYEH